MLKPALARGELHCIGATTLDEYRKNIEKDAALARRFQPVFVGEPTVEETISILRGLKEKYEIHHGVRITDSAIVAAATLSQPLHHRSLPARQGHRPDRRGGEPPAHARSEFEARGARRARPAHHPAQDRARGAEEGDGPGLQGSAQEGRAGGRRAGSQSADLTAQWRAEKEKLVLRAAPAGAARPGPQRARDRAAPRRSHARRRTALFGHSRSGAEAGGGLQDERPCS